MAMANKHIFGYHANDLYLSIISEEIPYTSTETYTYKDPTNECKINEFLKLLHTDWVGFAEVTLNIPLKFINKFLPIFVNKCDIINDDNYKSISYNNLIYILNHVKGQPNKGNIKLKSKIKYLYSPVIKWYISHGAKITAIHTAMTCKCDDSLKCIYDKIIESKDDYSKLCDLFNNIDKKELIIKLYHDKLDTSRTCTIPITCYDTKYIFECFDVQGIVISQLSSLRLMQFYYDFICKYIDSNKFDLIKVEQNKLYIVTTENTYEKMVKPDMLTSFENEKTKWLSDNNKHGLFTVCLTANVTTDYGLSNIKFNIPNIINVWYKNKEYLTPKELENRYMYVHLYNNLVFVNKIV